MVWQNSTRDSNTKNHLKSFENRCYQNCGGPFSHFPLRISCQGGLEKSVNGLFTIAFDEGTHGFTQNARSNVSPLFWVSEYRIREYGCLQHAGALRNDIKDEFVDVFVYIASRDPCERQLLYLTLYFTFTRCSVFGAWCMCLSLLL